MKLIVVRGPLGVGKSTIAKQLSERLNGLYIAIDDVLEKHGLDSNVPVDSDGIPVERFLQVNAILKPAIEEAITNNQLVILDGNYYYLEPIEQLNAWYPDEIAVFTLVAPVALCIERDAQRNKPYGEDSARAVYTMVNRIDIGTDIDATGSSHDVIQSIIDKLHQ